MGAINMVAGLCHFVISLFVFSPGFMTRHQNEITPSEKTKNATRNNDKTK